VSRDSPPYEKERLKYDGRSVVCFASSIGNLAQVCLYPAEGIIALPSLLSLPHNRTVMRKWSESPLFITEEPAATPFSP
jgi:hypothetical protein